jgi:hypothetical protein
MPHSSIPPEESAHFLLTIFLKLEAKVGEPIPGSTLATNFCHPPWNNESVELAIEIAVKMGCIIDVSAGSFTLTESGVKAAFG